MVAKISEKVTKAHFTDCHCHLLPGLDDGPSGIQEALEMAHILSSFGFSDVFCTPHLLKGAYEKKKKKIGGAAADLRTALDREGTLLAVHACIEYYLDEYLLDSLAAPLPLADNIVLIEAPQHVQPRFFVETVYQIIIRKKLRPLIAHPERYDIFDDALTSRNFPPKRFGFWPFSRKSQPYTERHNHRPLNTGEGTLDTLREMGCLFQGNIGSFAGFYGEQVRKRAIRFLDMGLYDRIGTDAHHAQHLEIWLKTGMNVVEHAVGREGLSRLLSPFAIRDEHKEVRL